MKSRWVMLASAVFMAVLGLAGTFLPHELLTQLRVQDQTVLALVIQVAGAMYLAFAMLNWMAKDSLIGGIYNRPVAMGNLVHFMVGGLSLLKGALASRAHVAVIVAAVLYALFALGFARIVFTSPVKSGEGTELH